MKKLIWISIFCVALAALSIITFNAWSLGDPTDSSKIADTAMYNIHYDQTKRLKPEKEAPIGDPKHAMVIITPKTGSEVAGAVTFSEVEGGVRILADFAELHPGKHGFHIHEHGDCSADDASSAGGHFNPTNKKHGGPDSEERHIGDLGNLEANRHGFAHYDRIDTEISLRGENSIIGKSIVIHEKEDDLTTDSSGNAGRRIGCGLILEAKL